MKIDYKTATRLFLYDPSNGVLYWRKKNSATTTVTGKGYLSVMVNGYNIMVHRIIWLLVYGVPPMGQIDHINGVKTDNRTQNLRVVNNEENHKNMKRFSNNSSGCVGVTWDTSRNKWFVSITIKGKTKALGRFIEFADAVMARKSAEHQFEFHKNHGRK
jgi:hypothetical protein